MRKKTVLFLAGASLVLLIFGASVLYRQLADRVELDNLAGTDSTTQNQQSSAGAADQDQTKQLPPDFTVVDAEGREVKLSDFRGKPVVVNFWASWCGPCKSEMPAFQQAWETYCDKVQFLLINLTDNNQETVASAQSFLAGTEYTFPVYFDTALSGAMAYGVVGIPATYFVDENGFLIAGANYALNYETLEYGISLILEEN